MDDADAGRHDREGLEGLLAPLEELVALAVADELDLPCCGRARPASRRNRPAPSGRRRGRPGTSGSIFSAAAPAGHGGVAHRGDIDEQRHAGEVLQDDAGDGERDLVFAGVLGVLVGEVPDVGLGDLAAVDVAQDGLEDDPDGDRELGEVREPLLGEGGKGVELAFGAGAGGECAERVHGQNGGRMGWSAV